MISAHPRRIVLAIVLLLSSCAGAVAQDQSLALSRKATSLVEEEMAKQKIAGLSIAIVIDKKIVYSKAFGSADLENRVPASTTTLFRTGSIAKPLTAMAAMALYQSGKLDLDAAVQKYCPAFPQKQWTVTTRELLGHLAGVRHYKQDGSDFLNSKHYAKLTDGFELFASDPLLFEPGTNFSYSTYGYSVVGCVVEGVTGKDIGTSLHDLVFVPAGMSSTRVDVASEIVPMRSRPYSHDKDRSLVNATFVDTSYKIPGGGLVSTSEDLAKFAIALDMNAILNPETTKLAWTPQTLKGGKVTSYGLGWAVHSENGVKVVEHGGSQQGASSELWMAPELGFVVAIMANTDEVNVNKIAQALAADYLAKQHVSATVAEPTTEPAKK
jgi:serine beta-lactamase-like protein LACTB, mitochondrial